MAFNLTFQISDDKKISKFKHGKDSQTIRLCDTISILFCFFLYKISSMTYEFMEIYLCRVETIAVQIQCRLSLKWLSEKVAGDCFRD